MLPKSVEVDHQVLRFFLYVCYTFFLTFAHVTLLFSRCCGWGSGMTPDPPNAPKNAASFIGEPSRIVLFKSHTTLDNGGCGIIERAPPNMTIGKDGKDDPPNAHQRLWKPGPQVSKVSMQPGDFWSCRGHIALKALLIAFRQSARAFALAFVSFSSQSTSQSIAFRHPPRAA